MRIGGFNLLPYRQRDARLARRRCVTEWLGAAMAGGFAVLAFAGIQWFEAAQLDAQRASIGRSLAELGTPLAEHARLVQAAADRRARAILAETISLPLTHLLDLLDALSGESANDVVVQELRHRPEETQIRATAADHVASAAWLKQLGAVRDATGVALDELHRTVAGPQGDISATRAQVDFAARLRWKAPPTSSQHPPLASGGTSARPVDNRGDR
ncbi:MAG TPA: fimbrial assembly protein [Paraburkholderia sp.]|nr:fimbrial assembly protein [Paraburkholderia sp.]